MAYNYTYNDVVDYARKNNINIAPEDDSLARTNPDAGMSIVNYSKAWKSAKDESGRTAAQKGADAVRSQYGGYTGNSLNGNYQTVKASGAYDDTFTDQYAKARADALSAASNSEYKYNQESDPIYQQYKKSYLAAAQKAAEDAVGKYSAGTGTASSYTAMAAQQAANQYYSALADKSAELEQNAYNRYQNDLSNKWNAYSALKNESDTDYSRWQASRNQAISEAQTAASAGDYSQLERLGISVPDSVKNSAALENAITRLQATGDTSALKRLGVDTSYYDRTIANELYTAEQTKEANRLANEQVAAANDYQRMITQFYRNNPNLIAG